MASVVAEVVAVVVVSVVVEVGSSGPTSTHTQPTTTAAHLNHN